MKYYTSILHISIFRIYFDFLILVDTGYSEQHTQISYSVVIIVIIIVRVYILAVVVGCCVSPLITLVDRTSEVLFLTIQQGNIPIFIGTYCKGSIFINNYDTRGS